TNYLRPDKPKPTSPPPLPKDKFPVLWGVLSSNAEYTFRTAPSTSADSLGQAMGDEQWADIVGKQSAEKHVWLHGRLRSALKVKVKNAVQELAAGTEFWIVSDAFEAVVAPWDFFRAQLAAWE